MRDGDDVITDEDGMELDNMDAVQREAAHALADLTRDEVSRQQANAQQKANGAGRIMAIDVRDDNGPLLRVTFQYAIDWLKH